MLLLIYLFASGHSGRTDKSGGHYNHKTGKYHHHGGGSGGMGLLVIIGGVIVFLYLISGKIHKNK